MKTTWVKWMGLTALLVAVQASAAFDRPSLEGSLEEKSQSAFEVYPKPYHLFANRREGGKQLTSFTLHEDTGVRCVAAPCASDRKTEFRVRRVIPQRDGTIRYIAREVTEGQLARSLTLLDHRFCLHEGGPENLWEVRLTAVDGEREFTGVPHPIPVID